MANLITLPYEYYPDPQRGRPVYFGSIYIGEPDQDPELFPKQVYLVPETGPNVPIDQPLLTGAGGIVLYNGSPAAVVVEGNYSMRVRNDNGAEVYYVPNSAGAGAISEAYIPLAGTDVGAPVFGPIVYDSQNDGGWTITQTDLFGINAVIWQATPINSGFYINAKNPEGDTQGFVFAPNGQFWVPSSTPGDDQVWVMGAGEFLGQDNVLGFFSQDTQTTLQTANGIYFSTGDDANPESFLFGSNGKVIQTGIIVAPDNDQTLVTKKYVDDAISGGGSLPPVTNAQVLIGVGTAWQKAEHFFVNETAFPGTAVVDVTGSITLENIDTPANGFAGMTAGDNLASGTDLILYGTGLDDGVVISPEGVGVGDIFNFVNGFLVLPKDPTAPNHAATKAYVDAQGGLPSAILDETMRYSGSAWVSTGGVKVNSAGEMTVAQQSTFNGIITANAGVQPLLASAGPSSDGLVSQNGVGLLSQSGFSANDFVRLTGDQTISGEKTFTEVLRVQANINSDSISLNNLNPGSNKVLITGALGEIVESGDTPDDFANSSLSLSAGDGLNGGGTLTTNRSFSVDSTVARTNVNETFNANITVNGAFSLPNVQAANQFTATWNFGVLTYLSSDERLKENIEPSPYGLEAILELRPVVYDWIADGRHDVGLIAQQVELVIPEAIGTPEGAEYLAMREGPIISALIQAVQDLNDKLVAHGIF
jgi:hypothetical protein